MVGKRVYVCLLLLIALAICHLCRRPLRGALPKRLCKYSEASSHLRNALEYFSSSDGFMAGVKEMRLCLGDLKAVSRPSLEERTLADAVWEHLWSNVGNRRKQRR